MADKRLFDVEKFKINKDSCLFKRFIWDSLEQVVLNCIFERDGDEIRYSQERGPNLYKKC